MTGGDARPAGGRTFAGFPSRAQSTAIPNVFFSDLLPQLEDPIAPVVALYAFVLLGQRRGYPRYISHEELLRHPALLMYIAGISPDYMGGTASVEAMEFSAKIGIERCIKTGILLPLSVKIDGRKRKLLFLNTPADRRALESIRRGDFDIGELAVEDVPLAAPERTSLYVMYESLIGTLGPGMAEELTEAERLYPADWIEAAFHEAAAQNARSWRYISRILERWASEGRGHAKTHGDPADDDRYFAGKYGSILKRRLEG